MELLKIGGSNGERKNHREEMKQMEEATVVGGELGDASLEGG